MLPKVLFRLEMQVYDRWRYISLNAVSLSKTLTSKQKELETTGIIRRYSRQIQQHQPRTQPINTTPLSITMQPIYLLALLATTATAQRLMYCGYPGSDFQSACKDSKIDSPYSVQACNTCHGEIVEGNLCNVYGDQPQCFAHQCNLHNAEHCFPGL